MNNIEISQRLREFGEQKFGKRGMAKFAEALGMTPGALSSSYLSGRSVPGHKLQGKLRELGADVEFIMTGHKTIIEESNVFRVKGAWFKVVRSINAGDPEYIFSEVNYTGEDIWFPYEKTERCFSMTVVGDSMTSPVGKSIKEGEYILVDMDLDIINGDVVVVSLVNGRDLIKQYFANPDDNTVTLKSFNPRYTDYTVKADDITVMYRAVMSQPKPQKL